MINYDDATKENIDKHNSNWSQFPDHPWRILIVGGYGSGKTKASLYLVKRQDDDNYGFINKICWYVKDLNEAKYENLINKQENWGLKLFNGSVAFIKYLNDMDDVYKNVEEYNPNKKRKTLIVFDDMIGDNLMR